MKKINRLFTQNFLLQLRRHLAVLGLFFQEIGKLFQSLFRFWITY